MIPPHDYLAQHTGRLLGRLVFDGPSDVEEARYKAVEFDSQAEPLLQGLRTPALKNWSFLCFCEGKGGGLKHSGVIRMLIRGIITRIGIGAGAGTTATCLRRGLDNHRPA